MKPEHAEILRGIGSVFKEVIDKQNAEILSLSQIVAEHKSELAEVKGRVKAMDSRPELKFVGPYRAGESYAAGCFVQRSGGLWLAARSTSGIPGQSDSGWRLVVKEGRATT